MAIPAKYSLTPYTPGYPVKTGRTRLVGGRADVTLHAYGANGKYLVGYSYAAIEGYALSVTPYVTWSAITDGMYYYIRSSDMAVITDIPDTSTWDSTTGANGHNIQLAWVAEIIVPQAGSVDGKHIFRVQTACTGSASSGYYRLPASFSASSDWTAVTRYGVKETFQLVEDSTNWPDGAREEGMKYLSATFIDVADASYTEGALTFNGEAYTISPDFGGGDPLEGGCQLGLYSLDTDGITIWDPNDTYNPGGTISKVIVTPVPPDPDDYTKRLCGTGSIGSSEMPMYLPRLGDDSDFKTYSLWDRYDGAFASSDAGDYQCELTAKGKTVSWYACGKSNRHVGGGTLTYTRLNWAYRLNVDVVRMDGTAIVGIDPEFVDHSTPVDGLNVGWTGSTSPIRSGGGHWKLEGTSERVSGGSPIALVPNPPYATFAARTADIDGNPTNNDSDAYNGYFERDEDWSNWHIGPFELTNPTDFGLYGDQTRVLLKYPRSGHSLTVAIDTCTIDGFTAANWTGHGCTVTAHVGGGIDVTDVTPGAYITRTRDPAIHAPAQRYWHIAYTSDSALAPSLKIEGTGYDGAGNPVPWTKTYTHRLRDVYYDTCRPDEALGNDNEQSYIYQAQPEHEDGENSIISWGWGIGLFSEIRIANLEAGEDYTFTALQATKLTTDKDSIALGAAHQLNLLTAREYSPLRLLGTKTALPDDDRYEVERILQCSVNGRIGFESGAIYQATVHTGETTVTRTNLAVQGIDDGTNRWPGDELGSVGVTDELPWDDNWFDPELGAAGEYTDESALYCAEIAPAWFLVDGAVRSDGKIYVRPVFDQVSCGPHFGTGANVHTDAQPDCIELFATIYVGNRIHGVLWRDRETAEETEADETFDFTVDNPANGLATSQIGSFFTPYQLSPSTVEFETVSQEVTMTRHNTWTRLCMFIEAAIRGCRMRHGKWFDNQVLQPYRDVDLDTDI